MHFTAHNSTPHHINTFSHHTSFHPTSHQKGFTSHHLSCHTIPHHTIPHHTTIAQHSTSHYYIPHVHATSQTFNVATHLTSDHHILHLTSHYTAVCLTPPFHTTTSQSTCFTSHSHSHHPAQLFHTTPTFNITAHFTPHHIPHRIIPPHLDFTSHYHI